MVFLDVVIFYIFVGFLCFLIKTYGPTIIILWSEPRYAASIIIIISIIADVVVVAVVVISFAESTSGAQ